MFDRSLPDTSLRQMAQDGLVRLVYAVVDVGVAAWWFRLKEIVSRGNVARCGHSAHEV